MQDPLMPWYTFGSKSTLTYHHDDDEDDIIHRNYYSGSIPSPSRWSELTCNKSSFTHHAASAEYDHQYELLKRPPSIIGYEFSSVQQDEDQEQINRRAALTAAIERSKSSISGRICRDYSSDHSKSRSNRPNTAPVRRPKSATSTVSVCLVNAARVNAQRPRTAPTTRKEIVSRLGDNRVNRISQIEFLQFSKPMPIHHREVDINKRPNSSRFKSKSVENPLVRNSKTTEYDRYSFINSSNKKVKERNTGKSILTVEQILPSGTTRTNYSKQRRKTAWDDRSKINHSKSANFKAKSPTIQQEVKDHDDEDLKLARQAATHAMISQEDDLSQVKNQRKDSLQSTEKNHEAELKNENLNLQENRIDDHQVGGEIADLIQDSKEETIQEIEKKDDQKSEEEVKTSPSRTPSVDKSSSLEEDTKEDSQAIDAEDDNKNHDSNDENNDDRRLSVQSSQSEYIRSDSRGSSASLDDEGLDEFYRILSKTTGSLKKHKKTSFHSSSHPKTIKEHKETSPKRKDNVFLQVNDAPIKITRPKTGRSRSHTSISKISKQTSSTRPSERENQQDNLSPSTTTALQSPEANKLSDTRRNRSLSAPQPLLAEVKGSTEDRKPPEIRINEKDVVKVIIQSSTNQDQSVKKVSNRKTVGKNQVYNIRELLDIQMKTRRRHIHKVEEEEKKPSAQEKPSIQERKQSLTTTSHKFPTWLQSRIAFSKQACRFELPGDMKLLEEMTPMDYLEKHAVVSKRRKNLYSKYFIKINSTANGLITFKELIRAIRDLHLNYITERQIKDIITLIKVEESMMFGKTIFCAICALIERMLYATFTKTKYTNIDYGQKELIEVTDFSALKWKLAGCKIQDDLLHLLQSI
ncbi:hypothetical protein TrispH2_004073 [Trichoplax sp. H2]|nr:hypothetical protein TrispH2_004073 [Trichoplax sp. H2]|eukprot:RDD43024.1 hypothetical protein TrispH2_004073 [Trichoplax sp. H2]